MIWEVVLKDGTRFTGKRTWKSWWREALQERAFEVVDSATLPKGRTVNVPFSSMLYRVRVEKER